MNATLLDQIIEPFAECLTQDAARKIVAIRADEELQKRVDALADKANTGVLPLLKVEFLLIRLT